MAKAIGRKQATHKKARAHTPQRKPTRPASSKSSAPDIGTFVMAKPESQSIGDEDALQSESRVADDDADD